MSSLQSTGKQLENEWPDFFWSLGTEVSQIYKTIVLLAVSQGNIAEMISWLEPHHRILRPDVVRLKHFWRRNLGRKHSRKVKLSKEAVFWFLKGPLGQLKEGEHYLFRYYHNRLTQSDGCEGIYCHAPGANVSPEDRKYHYGFEGKILEGEVSAKFILHWEKRNFLVEVIIQQEEINESRVYSLISQFKRFRIQDYHFHLLFTFANCGIVDRLLKEEKVNGNHCWRGLKDENLMPKLKEIFTKLMAGRGVEITGDLSFYYY